MQITSKYILGRTLKPLVGAMTVGLMVLLAERMVRLLDVTLGKKNSFNLVFEMLAYLVPHYLGLAIPAAFFLGLLFGFNKLSKDSEVDAFLASGIGLHQLTRPVAVLGLGFAVLAIIIVSHVQPHTRYLYRALLHTVKNVEVFYLAEEGVFMNAGTRTFILDKLTRDSNRFERIFMYDNRGSAGSETITAAKGALIELDGEPRPVLRLEDGHRLQVRGPVDTDATKPLPRQTVGEFQLIDTPLGKLHDSIFRERGRDQRELTLIELYQQRNTPPKGTSVNAMTAEFHRRLATVATILVLPVLAIPFAMGRRRGQRPYRFGFALIILIAYNEIVEQGARMVRYDGVSPYLGVWLPFSLLALFALWRFYRTCFQLKPDNLEPVFDRINDGLRWIRNRIFPSTETV